MMAGEELTTLYPGFAVIHSCSATHNFPLNRFNNPISSGCSRLEHGEEHLPKWWRFPFHREWNQECNDFHDFPLVELYYLLWSF